MTFVALGAKELGGRSKKRISERACHALSVLIVAPFPAQAAVPEHTVQNGSVEIKASNPIIYDNDWWTDLPDAACLWTKKLARKQQTQHEKTCITGICRSVGCRRDRRSRWRNPAASAMPMRRRSEVRCRGAVYDRRQLRRPRFQREDVHPR